jgi:aerobic-type carbon monoxide dehydrogenase small subunit (CoxS/CutS family)
MARAIRLLVNGSAREVTVDPERPLLSVLRDDLDLTGCKYGCGEGQCGACTVLINGLAVRSCITPAAATAGKPITTIEGLAKNGTLHAVPQAFLDAGAMQCGYCIPGMIMSAVSFLRKNPNPTDADIIHGMQGNICRCGTHPRIVEAIRNAAAKIRSGTK